MSGIARRDFLKSVAVLPFAGLAAGGVVRPARGGLKILILGGTGFLGPHVVESARKRGHTLTLFNRGKTHPELFPDLEKLQGDRNGKLDALKGRKWDGVVDTSGYVPRIVRMSAELLKESGHYVFVSTVSVYPKMDAEDADESTPVATIADEANENVRENYGALKALCEKAAEAAMPGRVANVRPGLIVGPGDETHRFTYWPVRVRDGGEVLAPGKPEYTMQIIDVRDLADLIVTMIEQKTSGVYNAIGTPIPMEKVLTTSKAVAKSDATFTWVNEEFLAGQKLQPWAHIPAWYPPAEGKTKVSVVSNARALAKGYKESPLDVTVRDLLAWYATLPPEPPPPASAPASGPATTRARRRFPLSREREREVLAAWHAAKKK
jgi:2'-hydroxyisoflavone reductase